MIYVCDAAKINYFGNFKVFRIEIEQNSFAKTHLKNSYNKDKHMSLNIFKETATLRWCSYNIFLEKAINVSRAC